MSAELLTRDQVKVEDTWNLTDMFATPEDCEKELEKALEIAKELEAYKGKVVESPATLLKVYDLTERLGSKMEMIFVYSSMSFDEDHGNNEAQARKSKIASAYTTASSAISFVDPEILTISKDQMEEYIKQEPGLEKYRVQIEELYRTAEHTLSAELEEAVALTAEMRDLPYEGFSIFSDADMEFPIIKNEDGSDIRVTHGNFVALEMSKDREVRKAAYEALYGTHKKFINTFATLYYGQVKSLMFNTRMRKYPDNLTAAVDGNNVPPTVYKNLVDTVNANLDKMHAYVDLRKKCLGLDDLAMYDIYTPMIAGVDKKVLYEEAVATTLKALEPMGEDYLKIVKEAYANRWIDVYENKGKRSGAYSTGAYESHPYMLLNYTDTLDDMFTLIHEMGHSMHTYYSQKNNTFANSQYVIFVAEVASTCNEVLLIEYLLKNTEDKKERAYLLNHYLDMFKGTVYRQTMFAEYEMRSNALAESGEPLTADVLSALYLELNKKYYGESMNSDEMISYEWARIPHFYYNFYVYQYATSLCAAVDIAHRILAEGAPVVEQYKKFLSSGCTKSPIELLKIAGVNLETPQPIQAALDVFGGIIKELEELV